MDVVAERRISLSAALLLAVIAFAPDAHGQAGSAGGTIAVQGKSASGSTAAPRKPPARSRPVVERRRAEPAPRTASCSANILKYKWTSWAVMFFGNGDTTFYPDGRAIHLSGITGSWRCDGGRFVVVWPGEGEGHSYQLTREGTALVDKAGATGFNRAN